MGNSNKYLHFNFFQLPNSILRLTKQKQSLAINQQFSFIIGLSYCLLVSQLVRFSIMRLFSRSNVLHHFKISFPIPVQKVQNFLKKIQNLDNTKTSALCISFSGHTHSPESCQLLYQSLLNAREINRLSVFTFLQDKATSLTYFTATAGQTLTANPYSLIGDVGTTQKSYQNIKKLLDYLGVKYEQMGSKLESTRIWNQFVQKNDRQKQITNKWIQVVENNMINSISQRRGISKDNLIAIKNKLYHPKDALSLKLIDNVSTFQEFTQQNFPNHNVEDFIYKIDGTRLGSNNLSQRQISALTNFFQILELPQVALFSSTDPLQQSLGELFSLVETRLLSGEGIQALQSFLGTLFSKFDQMRGQKSQMMFEI